MNDLNSLQSSKHDDLTTATSERHHQDNGDADASPSSWKTQTTNQYNDMTCQLIEEISTLIHEQTTNARKELSSVHLPHSLTTYKQQLQQQQILDTNASTPEPLLIDDDDNNNNNENDDIELLWNRILQIKDNHILSTIKGSLIELRQKSDNVKVIYNEINKQLDEDCKIDDEFRMKHSLPPSSSEVTLTTTSDNDDNDNNSIDNNSTYGSITSTGTGGGGGQGTGDYHGHDVKILQRDIRLTLDNYDALLCKSQHGDEILYEKSLELLDHQQDGDDDKDDDDDHQESSSTTSSSLKYKLLLSIIENDTTKEQFYNYLLHGRSDESEAIEGGETIADGEETIGKTEEEDDENINNDDNEITVTLLSRLLVDLSTLFNDRDDMLTLLKNKIKRYDITNKIMQLEQKQPKEQQQDNKENNNLLPIKYGNLIEKAKQTFQCIVSEIHDNISMQDELMNRILIENEKFTKLINKGGIKTTIATVTDDWGHPNDSNNYSEDYIDDNIQRLILMLSSPSLVPAGTCKNVDSSSCNSGSRAPMSPLSIHIVNSVLEDAIEDIDYFIKHLKEGQDFYNLILPKLEKLQQQVNEISVRLTIERCDYEDKKEAQSNMNHPLNLSNNSTNSSSSSRRQEIQRRRRQRRQQQQQQGRQPCPHQHHRRGIDDINNSSRSCSSNNNNNNNSNNTRIDSSDHSLYSGRESITRRRHRQTTGNTRSSNDSIDDNRTGSNSNWTNTTNNDSQISQVPPPPPPPASSPSSPSSPVSNSSSTSPTSSPTNIIRVSAYQPGVETISHREPQVRVDDEKVASLVSMDFNPEKVVAALKKYDNNIELALNELLSES